MCAASNIARRNYSIIPTIGTDLPDTRTCCSTTLALTNRLPSPLAGGTHRFAQLFTTNLLIMSSTKPLKVCIIGSGNWGSAIARIVGENAKCMDEFEDTVNMWVFEETVDGRKLTEIINETHENIKYLKGYKIPTNVVAIADPAEAVKGAKVLIFVLPHQFIDKICTSIKGNVEKDALAISLIKGVTVKDKGLQLITEAIKGHLGLEVNCLMGANLAPEVAAGNFCETTIGCRDPASGKILKKLFQADYFRIVVVQDATTVELCGALKNIVAVGAGITDGLGLGDNTKAAVIRLGLMEMVAFTQEFYKNTSTATFLESCGVADLITTCYGGRNRRVAEAFVRTGKSIEELEVEMLQGQKLQGPQTAAEVFVMLSERNMTKRFPLFTAIYEICYNDLPAKDLITCLSNHPVHM